MKNRFSVKNGYDIDSVNDEKALKRVIATFKSIVISDFMVRYFDFLIVENEHLTLDELELH